MLVPDRLPTEFIVLLPRIKEDQPTYKGAETHTSTYTAHCILPSKTHL